MSLSYRPGTRNVKPDALSRQFTEREESTANPDTILPSTCLVAPLTWEVEERVRSALVGHLGPSTCPPDRLFVPAALRSDVLQWMHNSNLTCHPELSVLKTQSSGDSGGPRWRRTPVSLWGPVLSAVSTRSPIRLLLVFSTLCRYPTTHGPTYLWTL